MKPFKITCFTALVFQLACHPVTKTAATAKDAKSSSNQESSKSEASKTGAAPQVPDEPSDEGSNGPSEDELKANFLKVVGSSEVNASRILCKGEGGDRTVLEKGYILEHHQYDEGSYTAGSVLKKSDLNAPPSNKTNLVTCELNNAKPGEAKGFKLYREAKVLAVYLDKSLDDASAVPVYYLMEDELEILHSDFQSKADGGSTTEGVLSYW